MLCDLCHNNDASVHVKQSVNGVQNEIHVCETCARAQGYEIDVSLPFSDFLFGEAPETLELHSDDERRCATCGFSSADFRKQQRMGCPSCYDALSADIAPMLRDVHPSLRHTGKVPTRVELKRELIDLRRSLEQAVVEQDFETAATLRDRIGVLERNDSH